MFELLPFILLVTCTEQKCRGIIYVRVSTKEQAEKGFSLLGQIEEMEEEAKKKKIALPYPPIIDKETGKHFERFGLEKVMRLAEQRKVEYVLTPSVDRWGRNKKESIQYAIRLTQLGVKIVTKDMEWDFDRLSDLIMWVIESDHAEKELHDIVDRTQRGKRMAFKDKKWIHSYVPRGYERNGDWLRKMENKDMGRLIVDVFGRFEKEKRFALVIDGLGKRFQEVFDEKFTPGKLKSILRNPVYAGRPTYGKKKVVAEDPDLAVISWEDFEEVQKILDNTEEGHRKKGRTPRNVVEDLAREYGWGYVLRVIDNLIPHCCKCGGIGKRIGGKTIYATAVGRYKCRECGYYFTIPTGAQLDEFRCLNLIRCPYCGETEYFDVNERLTDEGYKYEYICKHCHGSFLSPAKPDKYLRRYPPRKDKKSEKKEVDEKQENHTERDFSVEPREKKQKEVSKEGKGNIRTLDSFL